MIPTWGAAFGANAIFNSAEFRADLTHSAVPDKAAPGTTGTFTRATTSTWPNNDGYMVTGVAGEIGFPGARRVRNLLTYTEDFSNAAWTKINGGAGSAPTVTSGFTDPDGGTTAWRLQANAGGVTGSDYSVVRQSIASAITYGQRSIYIKSNTGVSQVVYFGAAESDDSVTATTEWQQLAVLDSASSVLFDIGCYRPGGVGSGAQSIDVLIWHPNLVNITGETDQTTIRPYVSVGVESAPYYHGSFVDGVKCFNTDIAGNPLPTEYTYDAVSLNGVAGTYVSTPDSVAASIVGSIDIDVKAAMNDWTPAAIQTLLGKDTTAGNNRSYLIYVNTNGTLEFGYTNNGSSFVGRIATSSVAPTVANGAAIWVRVTYNSTTGKVNFYTSADGESWTALGTEQTITSGAIYDGTGIVEVGSNGGTGTSNMFAGKIYRARIYNGIRESGGTLAVDFDASRYAGGTTLTGSTGETWTLQGNAVIHPTNSPMLGYQAEGARTNLCLQSNAFTTTWGTIDAPAAVQNVIGPDGATSAWTVTDANAGTFDGYTQSISASAGGVYCLSLFIKKAASATAYPLMQLQVNTAVASYVAIIVNHVAGTINAVSGGAYVAPVASRIEDFNSDYWRVQVSGTQAGGTLTIAAQVYPAASSNGTTLSAAAQGSAVFYGAQVELGSFASSYIPTTTIAVTRNADVLTYSSAGNILGTVGWAYAELSTYWNTAPPANWNAIGFGASIEGLIVGGVTGAPTEIRAYDGSNSVTQSSNPTMYLTPRDTAMTWGGSSMSVAQSGVATSGSFDGNIGTTAIGVGNSGTGTGQWNGTIRNVRIGQRQLSASEMQAITS